MEGLTKIQGDIMTFAKARGAQGFTDLDFAEHFDDQGSTYRSRRAELVAMGQIEDSGERVKPKEGGWRYRVWRAA